MALRISNCLIYFTMTDVTMNQFERERERISLSEKGMLGDAKKTSRSKKLLMCENADQNLDHKCMKN